MRATGTRSEATLQNTALSSTACQVVKLNCEGAFSIVSIHTRYPPWNYCITPLLYSQHIHVNIEVFQYVPELGKPICLHTTAASEAVHELSQIVPHCPSIQISTLPTLGLVPSANLISPVVQLSVKLFVHELYQQYTRK